MSKPMITKLFVGGIVALFAGLALSLIAGLAAWSGNAFQMSGPEVTGINPSSFAWTMITLALLGALAMVGGAIAGLVAWVGALLNTAQLDDKAWFVLLLILGLFSFGFIAMVAYVMAGPDGTRRDAARPAAGLT